VFAKKTDDDETGETVSIELLPCTMGSFINKNTKLMPYFAGLGQSPMNDNDADAMPLTVSAWQGLINGYPLTSSVARLPGMQSFNFNVENGLDSYIERWSAWQQNKEEITIPLTNISIWELMEMIALNKPDLPGQKQKRWVRIKGVHCLPKQFSFIIDINGRIIEAEAIVVKKNAV
jgi:hypothetical protein